MSVKQEVFIKSYRELQPRGDLHKPEPDSLRHTQTSRRLSVSSESLLDREGLCGVHQADQHSQRKEVEDDLETLLDTSESMPPYDVTGKTTYERACIKVGVTPARCLLRKLDKARALDLQHYGFGPRSIIPVTMALMINRRITEINLRGNCLGASGMAYIQTMMEDNNTIIHINLATNNLQSKGATHIASMLSTNKTLRVLDISENGFVDADAVCLAKAIENHSRLTVLNLSRNAFGDPSASCFSHMIAENGVLEDLNLSWNHFRVKGAQELGDGLAENESLKSLNLSWNGAEDEGMIAVGRALSQNSTLQHIDLTSNRISSKGFLALLKVLPHNEGLKSIRVGKNNISTAGAKAAVAFLKTISNLALQLLDLSDIILNSSIKPLLEELKQMHPELQIAYGYTDSYGKHKMRSYDMVAEALSTMQSFCQENKIQLVEMFARFDADGSTSLTKEEFNEGLKEAKIPLTTQHVDKLIEELDKDGDKEIDFSELVIGAGQKSERKAKKSTMKL